MRARRNTCAGTMEVAAIVKDVNFISSADIGFEQLVPNQIPEPIIGHNLPGFKNGRSICEDSGGWGVQSVRMEYEQGCSPLAAK